jgi:hypothetical protein
MQFMPRSKGMFSQFWDIQSRGSSTNSVRVELKGEVILKLNTINVGTLSHYGYSDLMPLSTIFQLYRGTLSHYGYSDLMPLSTIFP